MPTQANRTQKISFLLPVTMDAQPDPDADTPPKGVPLALLLTPASVTKTTPEGELLASLDSAYSEELLPSDLSWYLPISCDLPDGWEWLSDSHGAKRKNGSDTLLVTKTGVLHVTARALPVQVVAAVLARFVGKVEG